MKTSELIGPELDWAVAKCEGGGRLADFGGIMPWTKELHPTTPKGHSKYCPSTDWAQGGPIIEREGIELLRRNGIWYAGPKFDQGVIESYGYPGPTMLIAAMRCYVASKLGDEAEIPEELR